MERERDCIRVHAESSNNINDHMKYMYMCYQYKWN
jgi:hypothetical protein